MLRGWVAHDFAMWEIAQHRAIHFFPLIDLVDELGGMVDQSYRRFARDASAPEPVHIGNAQAVETKVCFLDLDEELLPPA